MEDNGYDIEYKQVFLRNEILNSRYDPNVFLEFLMREWIGFEFVGYK